MPLTSAKQDRPFNIQVMGRTLEHLGVQMYKRRDAALAELVANAWDADATFVDITLPTVSAYSAAESAIVIVDNGGGMSDEEIQEDYLVIGRNRRRSGSAIVGTRKVMGRKGIGKLAGFGLAQQMTVESWRDGVLSTVVLDADSLKTDAGDVTTLTLPGSVQSANEVTASGTRITLRGLKHLTALDPTTLRHNLARRFSRTVRGNMTISVNGVEIEDQPLTFTAREPIDGELAVHLEDGNEIRWWAGFSDVPLNLDMRGFVVLVRGKTAQAPPFFFGVEGVASGQHTASHLTGIIEADFLDEGTDDASDRISTDRQQIDWQDSVTKELKAWGERTVRRLFREHANRGADVAQRRVLEDPGLKSRLEALDGQSKAQATKFIRAVGASGAGVDKTLPLADTILRAYEYRQFHDYIELSCEGPGVAGPFVISGFWTGLTAFWTTACLGLAQFGAPAGDWALLAAWMQ